MCYLELMWCWPLVQEQYCNTHPAVIEGYCNACLLHPNCCPQNAAQLNNGVNNYAWLLHLRHTYAEVGMRVWRLSLCTPIASMGLLLSSQLRAHNIRAAVC